MSSVISFIKAFLFYPSIALTLSLSWLGLLSLCGTRSDMPAMATGARIRQVRPHMNAEQVVALLGNPFRIRFGRGEHNISCSAMKRFEIAINRDSDVPALLDSIYRSTQYCCEGNKKDMQRRETELIYTKPVILASYYPMLSIHLDSAFRVNSVYAKRYTGGLFMHTRDEKGFYYQFDGGDTISGITPYCHDLLFAECFR